MRFRVRRGGVENGDALRHVSGERFPTRRAIDRRSNAFSFFFLLYFPVGQNARDDVDAETEEVLNEFSFLGSDSEDASHELRMQTDTTDWGELSFFFFY